MSYDMSFRGTLVFPSRKAAEGAVAALRQALDDEDAQSVVSPDDLVVKGTSLVVDVETSAPATLWDDTHAALEIVAATARSGTIKGTYEGGLVETVKARGARRPPPKAKAKAKAKPTTTRSRKPRDPRELRFAAQFGQLDKVEELLAAGADPSAQDGGTSPLMMAAYHGQAKVVERLIAAGANLDAQDELGYTALFHAAGNKGKRGRQRCIELLVLAGADPDIRNKGNAAALETARALRSFDGAAELEALLAKRPR